MTPPGKWLYWLLLAGRGFGKTKTGAEDVAHFGLRNPDARVAIVVPTFTDGRDVCIEGESGLLNCLPAKNVADWNRSIGELFLTNRSSYRIYTAEKPDRLRGPQHHRAWCDELACLIPGTLIATSTGYVPIEDIRPGMLVDTRKGFRKVRNSWQTKSAAQVYRTTFSDGSSVVATGNHPFWVVGRGFVPLRELICGYQLLRIPKSLGGTTVNGTERTRVITKAAMGDSCTEKSIESLSDQYLKGLMSTTKMRRSGITLHQTSRRYRNRSIQGYTSSVYRWPILGGVAKLLKKRGKKRHPSSLLATSVQQFSPPWGQGQDSVQQDAKRSGLDGSHTNRSLAGVVSVKGNLPTISTSTQDSAVPTASILTGSDYRQPRVWPIGYAHPAVGDFGDAEPNRNTARAFAQLVTLVSVQKVNVLSPVYDIEVEDAHEFFANGILVHNSWRYGPETWSMLQLGLRLGKDTRTIITTTPRPVKLLRDLIKDPDTFLTRGTTFENRDNLSENFFKEVSKYEGTRLGEQELYAKVLDDVPGSLWQRSLIDETRLPVADFNEILKKCRRVVVGVDPAVTSTEDADETGIIVAGIDENNEGYVFADKSRRDSPNGWASAAIRAFKDLGCDRIIGEVNNGGDLVENTLRQVDANIPFTKVSASRGKYVRAEPISALYEQHRIHHVGTFEELEDQMCMFTPENIAKNSPDRAEGLVWAFTELFSGILNLGLLAFQKEEQVIAATATKEERLGDEMNKIARIRGVAKPATSPSSVICPKCSSKAVVLIGKTLHCNQCGEDTGPESVGKNFSRADAARGFHAGN